LFPVCHSGLDPESSDFKGKPLDSRITLRE
jgi:hypothetical protein